MAEALGHGNVGILGVIVRVAAPARPGRR